MLAHYGVVALPCRVGDPDRKGKVESAVGHAQKTPLRGLRFEHLDDGQAYLDRWERRWADTRIHGTTKRQVAAMFAEERPALGPWPLEPFRYYQYGRRTVHLDGCVEVASAYYSAPPGWIGRRVDVQWNDAHVRLLDPSTGQLLREHLRAPRSCFWFGWVRENTEPDLRWMWSNERAYKDEHAEVYAQVAGDLILEQTAGQKLFSVQWFRTDISDAYGWLFEPACLRHDGWKQVDIKAQDGKTVKSWARPSG